MRLCSHDKSTIKFKSAHNFLLLTLYPFLKNTDIFRRMVVVKFVNINKAKNHVD